MSAVLGDPQWAALAWSVPATLLHAAAVAVLLRMLGQRAALPVMFAAAGAVFAGSLLAFGEALSFWHFGAAFGTGVVAVVFVYGTALKSLSFDLLLALDAAPEGRLDEGALSADVVAPRFSERAEIVVSGRNATMDDVGFRVTDTGRAAASAIAAYRRNLGVDRYRTYG